ncbi:hypothetical protein ILUMI_11635 [Ignelater luminosus]|uniref:Uncharacterized protein n=1 Tax=Ignelater luminosus TaxID=2038154 RepID=A0A8K0GD24_IGNLU|nr:hypothetical protein ILUMI_11635 [Ignelater luminosus]
MGDGTKRKLTMPPWHIPYLEKHRIYDLFHELARELVIQQPVDHVLFLKQILHHAAKSRDIARVIILSSPKVNGYEVAKQISQFTRQVVIGENVLLDCLNNPVSTN